jgi:hypothetical protein
MKSHRVGTLIATAALAGSALSLDGANAASAANVVRGTKWTATISFSSTLRDGTNTWAFDGPKKGTWGSKISPPYCGAFRNRCALTYVSHNRNLTVSYLVGDGQGGNYVFTGELNKTDTAMSGTVTCTDGDCAFSSAPWTAVPS